MQVNNFNYSFSYAIITLLNKEHHIKGKRVVWLVKRKTQPEVQR